MTCGITLWNQGSQMIANTEIRFEPLNESHFSLIHHWFNKPHVQAFYSLRLWTQEEIRKKLAPHLKGEKHIQSFIIYLGKKPVGYIQSYPIKDHPWDNQELSEKIIQAAAGFDLFIGEEENLRKGLGFKVINSFLHQHIWPYYRYCLSDPDIRNEASIHLFQKCGFTKHKKIDTLDALKRTVTLQLFIKERNFK